MPGFLGPITGIVEVVFGVFILIGLYHKWSNLVLLFIIAVNSTQEMGCGRGLVMALLGTVWVWMAGVILSECIGRTNWSPLSGMTLIAVTILIFIASGLGDKAAVVSAVMVGAAAW